METSYARCFFRYMSLKKAAVKLVQWNAMRYCSNQVPDYIQCASLTEDNAFRKVFRTESILLRFLNELLRDTLPGKLTHISIRGADQEMLVSNEYGTKHDVYARDDNDNRYVIEMERAFQLHDIIRFQYVIGKVFTKAIDSRFHELRDRLRKDATMKTKKAKEEAARTAEKNARNEGKTSAEVEEAKQKAVKRMKTVTPRGISHHDLFNHKEVPTALVVVIAEDGIPANHIRAHFTEKDQYVLNESYAKFGSLSKMNFTFVDLKRFADTQLLDNPKTELDHWCVLFWQSKEKQIKKKEMEKLQRYPAIADAIDVMGNLATQDELEQDYMANRDETLRDEGRDEGRKEGRNEGRDEMKLEMVRAMLKEKMPDAHIMKVSGISEDELMRLKSSSP